MALQRLSHHTEASCEEGSTAYQARLPIFSSLHRTALKKGSATSPAWLHSTRQAPGRAVMYKGTGHPQIRGTASMVLSPMPYLVPRKPVFEKGHRFSSQAFLG